MPRNASGTYSLPSGNPVVAGTTIEAAWANNTLSDVGNELTNSLSRQGTGGMLAALRLADGSVTVPGLAFVSETTTGFYRAASNDMRMAILGSDVWAATSSAFTISKAVTLSVASNLGTPSALTLTNATGLPLTTGVTGTLPVANGGTGITAFGTGVATALGQNVTGSGGIVLATSPTLTTPNLGTPSAVTLTNATGLPVATGISGLGTGVAAALAVNTGSAGAFVVNGGALGTPSSGTVTNLTGTASININGTVGATTPNTGSFTTLTTSSTVTLSAGTANGVLYLNGSKVATSGSALTFSGGSLTTTGSFAVSDGTNVGEIKINAATLDFNTSSSGVPQVFRLGSSEQMRLTSTGLGIGTSSPGQKLDVSGADGVRARVVALAGGTPGLILSSSGNTAYTFKAGNADNSLRIDQDGNDRITLASGGNLGIGTTSPVNYGVGYTTLAINNTTAGVLDLMAGGVSQFRLFGNASENRLQGVTNVPMTFYTNNTERARITSGGDLLVGTTSDGAAGLGISNLLNLTFPEGSGTSYANLFRQSGSGATILANGYKWSNTAAGFASSVGTSWAKSAIGLGAVSGGTITFYTDAAGTVANGTDVTPSERARITSTGNVVAGGSVALATNATDGFLYVPTCAGTPTGTPTAITGMAPIVVDTTNNKLYFYSGGQWRDAGP